MRKTAIPSVFFRPPVNNSTPKQNTSDKYSENLTDMVISRCDTKRLCFQSNLAVNQETLDEQIKAEIPAKRLEVRNSNLMTLHGTNWPNDTVSSSISHNPTV